MVQEKLKIAIIVGASEALKQKAKNPAKTDESILRDITERTREIAGKIDSEEEF